MAATLPLAGYARLRDCRRWLLPRHTLTFTPAIISRHTYTELLLLLYGHWL